MPASAKAVLFSSPRKMLKPSGERAVASCESAWSQPWRVGAWSQLDLNAFDSTDLLQEQRSLVLYCEAPLGVLGPSQKEAQVVPCMECPQGYDFSEPRGVFQCRPSPSCNTQRCETCQVLSNRPFSSGTCDSCVSYGCDPNSNRCSCG